MKFVLLDVYPEKKHRLIKDTSGGYGTGNNFGNTFFSKLLNLYVDNNIGMPAMEVMYISSILKENHQVFYTRNIKDKIIENADYIVLPTSIIAHETEVSALDELKNKKFFVTGIFGNIFKEKYLRQNSIVVKNESEVFFFNLNKSGGINKKNLDNLFINKELTNSYYEQVSLDELPFPDWESYIKNYPLRNNFFGLNQKIAIPLLGTRGCPYSCFNYCTYPLQQGRKVRARSVENIILEIKFWQKKLGTSKFVFRDPVFSIDKKHTIQLCKEIIQQSLNIKFMIETHLNNLDNEMIPLLATAGLELVYVGVESSNMSVLKDMKRFTIKHDEQYKVIKKCEDAGIKVKTMFIFGSPEDTEETILDTIKYSRYLPSLYAQYSIFTPYPGTPIYNEYKEKIYEKKFENFNQYKLVFKHKNLSEEQIEKLKSLAYYKYYFNIKKIFTILKYFINSMYAKKN
jgi:radical SAM superfamily enzyme YgiQ (UPF0313 family)